MMGNIEYDFSKFDGRKMPQVSIAIRTELLDKSTKTFMDRHPDANVINLGCGLDTRFSRLDNSKTHWYDLDLPESIHLRRQFFNETDRYKMIAEILMYFTEQEVNELMDKMVTNFPDAEMLIETILPSLVKQAKNRI